jgi:cell wall-associated NlpC family hydrolase
MSMPHDGVGHDHDSVGIYQQQPDQGWGTPAQDMTPRYAATRFFEALKGITGWQNMTPGLAGQAVQSSGDLTGQSYTQWLPDAEKILAHYKGAAAPPATSCAPTSGAAGGKAPNQKIATVIAAERHYLGTPYAWGGGSDSGPGLGQPPDTGVVGFDCSSLQMYAWHKVGVNIPRTSAEQYSAGRHVPIGQIRVGDLLFWSSVPGDQAAIHHVALYLGDVKGAPSILQAPQSGEFVDIRPLAAVQPDQLMPQAVRLT